jgi:hypothetical protein
MITQELVKEKLTYDEKTGVFMFINPKKKSLVGRSAGRRHKTRGYREIYIGGKHHYAHRLAWIYMTGEIPNGHIDHISHNKDDNSLDNLRLLTCSQNGMHRKTYQKNNKLKTLGVSMSGNNYCARINKDGKCTNLGTYKTIEEASDAYQAAHKKRMEGVA